MFHRLVGVAGLAACALIVSCGTSKGSSANATSPPPGQGEPPDPIRNTTVYDEQGKALKCSEPQTKCANEKEASIEFRDQCKLAGYQIMKCGCQHVCSGSVTGGKDAYDAQGNRRQCAPAKPDCEPKETSAAFQDACAESGHKFVICGCEWLCAGKLKHPVVESKPPPEEETPPADAGKPKPGDKTAKPPATGKKP